MVHSHQVYIALLQQHLQVLLTLVTSVGAGLLALILWRRNLTTSYRAFTWYLVAECVTGLATAMIIWKASRNTASLSFQILQPVIWFFYIGVALEIYKKCLYRFKGIARVGQQVLVFGLLGSMVLSVSTVQPDWESSRHIGALNVLYITAAHRVITGGITLFLLLLAVVLNWFPVPIAANTIFHTAVSFFFFLSMTVAHLYRNLTGRDVTDVMNIAVMAMGTCCLVAWAVGMVSAGEADGEVPPRSPGDSSWLLAQMEAINRALMRVAK